MKNNKLISLALPLLIALLSGPSNGQTQPPTPPPSPFTPDNEPSIGPLRIRKLAGYTYLHITRTTSLREVGQVAGTEMMKLVGALKINNIQPTGPAVLTYHNANGDPSQKFDLDVGIEVADNTVAPTGYQVKHIPPTLCGTIIFGGPIAMLKKAYGELYGDLTARNLIATGENREYYLAWDGVDSANNVLLLAVCAG